ncbi:MAG: tetratricopeptide repeat protein [Alphaproteobacteria bacterium]|nr:tetratricopeptide repeat protein [Alphaproteobacteria bacterium]
MRISVQLIEGSTGNHVWAERFDRQVVDIFDLQDEITRRIAAAVEPEIFAIEGHNASHRNVTDLSIWEDMMRARVYFGRMTATDTNEAIRLLSDVLNNHPDLPLANSLLSFMYLFSVHMGWLPPEPYKATADRLARKAVTLDEQDAWGHIALGYVRMMERSTNAAVSELTRALDLNPNSATAYGYRGLVNAFGARAEAALEDADQAIRLSPRDPQLPLFLAAKNIAKFQQRDFEGALLISDQILEMRPEFIGALRLKSAMLAHIGRTEEAHEILKKVLDLQPGTNLTALEEAQPYATEDGMDLFLEGMKLAGLD